MWNNNQTEGQNFRDQLAAQKLQKKKNIRRKTHIVKLRHPSIHMRPMQYACMRRIRTEFPSVHAYILRLHGIRKKNKKQYVIIINNNRRRQLAVSVGQLSNKST